MPVSLGFGVDLGAVARRGCWVGAGYWWCLLLLRYVSTSVKGRVMNVNSEVQSPCHPSVRVFVFT